MKTPSHLHDWAFPLIVNSGFTPLVVFGSPGPTLFGLLSGRCSYHLGQHSTTRVLTKQPPNRQCPGVGRTGSPSAEAVAGDEVTHLFEVKTDISTTSLYQGVGQLMLHGAALDPVPRRILVVPGQPSSATRQALERLEVAVLAFDWKEGQVIFPHLKDLL